MQPRIHVLMFSCLLSLGAFGAVSWGQSDRHTPALVLLREQSQIVAKEIARSVVWNVGERVRLNVKAETTPILLENALIAELQQRSLHPLLGNQADGESSSLEVLLLAQRANFRPLAAGGYERVVETMLEARYTPAGTREVRILGTFQRSRTDTVDEREELKLFADNAESGSDESPIFQKLITPLVLISGAFVIVYLFFTVRN